MNSTSVVTRSPAAVATSASRALVSRSRQVAEAAAQLVEDEDEDHDGQCFDRELGHRQIGRAEQRVEERDAVTNGSERQHGGHVRPREGRRDGRRDDQRRDHPLVGLYRRPATRRGKDAVQPRAPYRRAPPTSG